MMNWSTPTRVRGQRTLSIIPNELYLEIIDYIDHAVDITPQDRERTLSSFALVCRLFSAVAVPRIFRSIYIGDTASDRPTARGAKFCRAIAQGKEPAASLASHVRECTLISWGAAAFIIRRGSLPDKHYVKAIRGVKTLTSLTLHLSSICDDVAEVKNISPLPLKKFSFILNSSAPLPDHHADFIIRLVGTGTLETLAAFHWPMTKRLLLQVQESVLARLELYDAHSCAVLWNALQRCRSLKTLRIHTLRGTEELIPVLPSSSVPNLRHLLCPPSMLNMVPRRLLVTLDLSGRQVSDNARTSPPLMSLSDVSLLKQSSREISKLRVPSHLLFIAPPAEHFPSVSELHIDCNHLNYDNRSMASGAALTEFIEKLLQSSAGLPEELDWSADLKLQHGLLPRFRIVFPNLTYVQFVEMVEWRRELASDVWTGRIPPGYDLVVRSVLPRLRPAAIKDIDGIFARLVQVE
ncbi:hypothetical protein LshimejAT787_0704050 [Lyophyllum shimeji]|uniref:F-box domain-containing protein n=1 Tax=Lyophyllum shimeji TaxID=47721 RepID=A0A9P3UQ82_LYOSH|nr:hypothetical protein LshimejAT787_0704050 [Lyophyllum shimeji]